MTTPAPGTLAQLADKRAERDWLGGDHVVVALANAHGLLAYACVRRGQAAQLANPDYGVTATIIN